MPRYAQPIAIAPEDLHTLRQWSRSSSVRAGLAERAKILLLAAAGLSNPQIAQQLGCSRPTVILWRRRYAQTGLDGFADKPRPGRPRPSARTATPRAWAPPSAHPPTPSPGSTPGPTSPARAGPDRPQGPPGRDPGRHAQPTARAAGGDALVN